MQDVITGSEAAAAEMLARDAAYQFAKRHGTPDLADESRARSLAAMSVFDAWHAALERVHADVTFRQQLESN